MSQERRGAAIRENGLSLVFGGLFLAALVGQALTGWAAYNNDQVSAGVSEVSLLRYLTSASFGVDVAENWQSEYLQFLLYILLTIWLVQRGSPESKELGKEGTESDAEQLVGPSSTVESPPLARPGDRRTRLYSHSLCWTMALFFFASWFAQSVAGMAAYDEQQLQQREDPLSWHAYVFSADFWNRTLQNWQSEFLAVGSFAIFAVFLRQRGSPESKPVGAPHDKTGVSG